MADSRSSGPWCFFLLTFGWSWLFWVPAALSGRDVMTFPVTLLVYAGGVGPALAGILLTCVTQGREGRRDYWLRVIDFRRIGPAWYAVIFLLIPLLTLLAFLMHIVGGGSAPEFEEAAARLSRPLTLVPLALFVLLFGPLPEEIGWRGYQLDRLQARWSALGSSLMLGVAHALWHLPLFFMQGYWHHDELGFGPLGFWTFGASVIALSVLFTWIYNHSQRSTLSAILFHFMGNFTGFFFGHLEDHVRLAQTVLMIIAAVVVTSAYGPAKLSRHRGIA